MYVCVCVLYECLLRPEIVGVPTGGHNVIPWECKAPLVPNPIPYLQHSHMSDVYDHPEPGALGCCSATVVYSRVVMIREIRVKVTH